MDRIQRFTTTTNVTFTNSISTSPGFSFASYAGGMVCSGTAGTLTLHVRPDERVSTLRPLLDSSGTAVTVVIPAGGGAVPLPDECYAATFIVAVSSVASHPCTILMKG